MAEFPCIQVELSKTYGVQEWREDLKTVLLPAGLYGKDAVFLFSDAQVWVRSNVHLEIWNGRFFQIKSETFLEDLNSVLNSGDVPNIYTPDELDKIYKNMKGYVLELGLPATKSNMYSIFQKRVRSALHTVLSMR